MQVKPNQVPIKCDCEYTGCGHPAGACDQPPIVKVHAFGLAANLCLECRGCWEYDRREATFEPLAGTVRAVELKTPKGKTFPRASRVHQGHPADCKVCEFWMEREAGSKQAALHARASELASELAAIRAQLRTPEQRTAQGQKAAAARWHQGVE